MLVQSLVSQVDTSLVLTLSSVVTGQLLALLGADQALKICIAVSVVLGILIGMRLPQSAAAVKISTGSDDPRPVTHG